MRSRYSNFGEIFIMMIGWAVVLAVLTKAFTPTGEPGTTGKSSPTPQVSMLLRHVGCNEQLKTTVLQALTSLQWLLKGGYVIDPKNGISGHRDVAISDGKIAAVSESIDESKATRTLDVRTLTLGNGGTVTNATIDGTGGIVNEGSLALTGDTINADLLNLGVLTVGGSTHFNGLFDNPMR